MAAPTTTPQQQWRVDDARILTAIDDLTARIDRALAAPGSPWPVRETAEVLRDTLALLRSEITR